MAISASILQNELKHRLPPEFLQEFPSGVEIAYAAIPIIRTLPAQTQEEVRVAFAESMATVWKAMIGFSAAGFISLFIMGEVPMQKQVDETYALDHPGSEKDHEMRPSGSGSASENTQIVPSTGKEVNVSSVKVNELV